MRPGFSCAVAKYGMSENKIDVCNSALSLIGAPTITSFDDGSREAEVCTQLYDHTYETLLAEADWNFAQSDVELARSTTTPTDPNYQYQYLLPSDRMSVVEFYDNAGCEVRDYHIQGDYVLASDTKLFVKYNTKPAENELPSWFERYLVVRLAHDFEHPVMGVGSVQDRLLVQLKDARLQAYKQDKRQDIGRDAYAPSQFILARYR